MTKITERNKVIQKIADNEGITVAQLASSIGKASANLYDIQSGKIKGVSENLADSIVAKYPHYNKTWLMTGEGEMLRSQSINGDNNVQVGGNANNVNAGGAIEKALDQIAKAHELLTKMHEDADSRLAKSQEEIDRLISIIEKMQNHGTSE